MTWSDLSSDGAAVPVGRPARDHRACQHPFRSIEGKNSRSLVMKPARKRAVARIFEKYFANPQLRFALRRGLAPANFALLETTGRRTGLPRQTPVGGRLEGDAFWLVSEHGRRSQYAQNLIANPRVRVKTQGRWHIGRATLLPDDDARQRRQALDRTHGLSGRIDGLIFRAAATDPLTIRIDLDPSPA
jgi:deazaflavin-dependent oxidoreductase (nitroreductase family)